MRNHRRPRHQRPKYEMTPFDDRLSRTIAYVVVIGGLATGLGLFLLAVGRIIGAL